MPEKLNGVPYPPTQVKHRTSVEVSAHHPARTMSDIFSLKYNTYTAHTPIGA